MSVSVRRAAAMAATIPVLAALVLAAAPFASAGVPVAATVTITKVTDPASDPQDFVFSNGFFSSPVTFNTLDTDPTSLGTPDSYQFNIEPADLTWLYVGETEPSGWYLTDIQCTGDDDVSYNVDGNNVALYVDPGEDIRCTFYNTARAQLTVQKETVPGNDPQDFDFDLTGDAVPADLTLDTDPNSAFTGSNLTWSVLPDELGVYAISEEATSGWVLMDLECTGDDDSTINLQTRTATLDIDAGELIQCVFTNGKLPIVRLTKVTVPASDPQDFYIDVKSIFNTALDTDPASLDTLDTDWTSLADDELGPRTVEETVPEGWTLTGITCPGDAEAQVSLPDNWVVLDVDADEDIHCTFTNTKDADETEPPPTDEPTIDPTDESGGESDAPTEPGTSTETKAGDASSAGVGIALVALILLSGVLLLTRPKRAGRK